MNLHRLRLLRELKHRGTVTAVAEALSYVPSAVSHQLSLLEDEIGVPLTVRHGRRVRLTDAAERLVQHAEAIFLRVEQAQSDLESLRDGLTGTLHIACFQTAALHLIPGTLERIETIHPQLRLNIKEMKPEDSLPALRAADVDIIIDEEYPGGPKPRDRSTDISTVAEDPMLLLAPASTSPTPHNKEEPQLKDFSDSRWIMEPEGSAARTWAIAACRSAGFEPDVQFESSDMLVHRRLVEEGRATALVPGLVLAQPTRSAISIWRTGYTRRIFTAARSGTRERPGVQAVHDVLTAEYKSLHINDPTPWPALA